MEQLEKQFEVAQVYFSSIAEKLSIGSFLGREDFSKALEILDTQRRAQETCIQQLMKDGLLSPDKTENLSLKWVHELEHAREEQIRKQQELRALADAFLSIEALEPAFSEALRAEQARLNGLDNEQLLVMDQTGELACYQDFLACVQAPHLEYNDVEPLSERFGCQLAFALLGSKLVLPETASAGLTAANGISELVSPETSLAEDIPAEVSPAEEYSAEESPAEASPAEASSTEESSTEASSTEESSTEERSTEESSTEESSTEESSTEESSTEERSTEESSAEESLTEKDHVLSATKFAPPVNTSELFPPLVDRTKLGELVTERQMKQLKGVKAFQRLASNPWDMRGLLFIAREAWSGLFTSELLTLRTPKQVTDPTHYVDLLLKEGYLVKYSLKEAPEKYLYGPTMEGIEIFSKEALRKYFKVRPAKHGRKILQIFSVAMRRCGSLLHLASFSSKMTPSIVTSNHSIMLRVVQSAAVPLCRYPVRKVLLWSVLSSHRYCIQRMRSKSDLRCGTRICGNWLDEQPMV